MYERYWESGRKGSGRSYNEKGREKKKGRKMIFGIKEEEEFDESMMRE